MKLRALVVADPVEAVAQLIAKQCERLSAERVIAQSGAQMLEVVRDLVPEMVVMSLELSKPGAIEVMQKLRRAHPEIFVIGTFRELAVPMMERMSKLGVDDFMPHPLDLTEVFRAASRRFGIGFRRHDRLKITVEIMRADGVLIGRTIDLSEGGLLMEAIHPLAGGESVLVNLALPDGVTGPLRVRCHVLQVDGQAPAQVRARMQFENLRGREHARLVSYLDGAGKTHA